MDDPFAVLGLPATASLDEVRAARRRLAKELHPDHGGDATRMRDVNRAFDLAVKSVRARASGEPNGAASGAAPSGGGQAAGGQSASGQAAGGQSASGQGGDGQAGGRRPRYRYVDEGQPASAARVRRRNRSAEHDGPSFSIDVLPAEAFEALLIVATWAGQVLIDDPPYLLEVHLYEPWDCWCRLDLMPEAGASMVSITVAGYDGQRPPSVDEVRDLWVSMLNELGTV